MIYNYRLFTDKVELKNFTDSSIKREALEYLEKSTDFKTTAEPYYFYFGKINKRYMDRLFKIQIDTKKAQLKFAFSYLVFLCFYFFLYTNKEYLDVNLYDLSMYVFIPFMFLAYIPSKKVIEIENAKHTAALMKEQALCASMLFDTLYVETGYIDKLNCFLKAEQTPRYFLEEVFKMMTEHFLTKTNSSSWVKEFVIENFEKFTSDLNRQHNTNAYLHQNYSSIFKHVLPSFKSS